MKFRTKPCENRSNEMDGQKCKRDYAICKKRKCCYYKRSTDNKNFRGRYGSKRR